MAFWKSSAASASGSPDFASKRCADALDHGAQRRQRRQRLGEMHGAGRQIAARLARHVPHEFVRLIDGGGRDARPHARPEQMGGRRHRFGVNGFIGHGQDLLAIGARLQTEADTHGAAHAERVPGRDRLQRVILLQQNQQHLVGFRRVRIATRRGDDAVGLAAIGNDGGAAVEGDMIVRRLRPARRSSARRRRHCLRWWKKQTASARRRACASGLPSTRCRGHGERCRRPSPGAWRRSWRSTRKHGRARNRCSQRPVRSRLHRLAPAAPRCRTVVPHAALPSPLAESGGRHRRRWHERQRSLRRARHER